MNTFRILLLFVPFAATAQTVSYNRDIRPIFSDTCFRCHGPDKSARKADMRLDLRDEATKATGTGSIPIVPGDAANSEVIARINANPPDRMPPESTHKTLSATQKDTIRRWITEGAKYESHWAYQPVQRTNPASAGNPVDYFIQASLAKQGWKLSPPADRRTQLRRVTLDLTGLPPTPEQVRQFENDKSADAWAKVVDRLLATTHYAEKQGMHWLDAVRYSDSAGFHGDNIWPSWPYRDYVLKAFRDNMPFDQFTREQLGGDLIPNATNDQKTASAFNRLNRYSAEGGVQPKEYLAKYAADRVRTVSMTWLGSTMGCAECHDHRFDPFTSKDFYSMKAFFADIRETGLISDRGANAWGTKLILSTPEQQARLDALQKTAADTKRELDEQAIRLAAADPTWEQRMIAQRDAGTLQWAYQIPTAVRAKSSVLKVFKDEPIDSKFYIGSLKKERWNGDGLIVAGGNIPDNDTYTVEIRPGAGTWTALGIDIHQDDTHPGSRLARGADRFVLSEVEAEMLGQPIPFAVVMSNRAGEHPNSPAMAAIDGDAKTGWATGLSDDRNAMIAIRFKSPVTTNAGSTITVRLRQESEIRRAVIGRFRVALAKGEFVWPELGEARRKMDARKESDTTLTLNIAVDRGAPQDVLNALRVAAAQRTEPQRRVILEYYEFNKPELHAAMRKLHQTELGNVTLLWSIPRTVVTEATEPTMTRILPRANWMDETNEIVQPAVPAFLGKLDTGAARATRLDLANWLVSPTNPLTARTFANRMWRQFFGTGISKTLEDLGSQGEAPAHPELLDWLASEFMQPSYQAAGTHRWDIKHLIRVIVMSDAYRQSSLSSPLLDEKDPDNRLIARQSRFRVDAETVRDIALSVSGLRADRFGGPPIKPVQPAGYLFTMNFPKRDYSESRGEDLYRRGVYTLWQRSFLHPSLLNFDAPTREECMVNRAISNTPLQALDLLNDPIFVETARAFAQRILTSNAKTTAARIDWAFEQALGRTAQPAERQILEKLYQESLVKFQGDGKSADALLTVGEAARPAGLNSAQLAAMTIAARTILNLHETITRN
jgi:hypothetical protein